MGLLGPKQITHQIKSIMGGGEATPREARSVSRQPGDSGREKPTERGPNIQSARQSGCSLSPGSPANAPDPGDVTIRGSQVGALEDSEAPRSGSSSSLISV